MIRERDAIAKAPSGQNVTVPRAGFTSGPVSETTCPLAKMATSAPPITWREAASAAGVLFVVGSIYVLAAPGRIDIIDGQYRFEVARNLLDSGSLTIRDSYLYQAAQGIGGLYSPYGISGSIIGAFLIAVGREFGLGSLDVQQFMFSLTSAVLGAATAAVLLLFYHRMMVPRRRALSCVFVAAFATLTFPLATSVFDQAQHGFFLLTACFLAVESRRRDSIGFAVAGGLMMAFLINYQETYAVLLAPVAVATLDRASTAGLRKRPLARFSAFVCAGAIVGLGVWALLNFVRFGNPLFSGKYFSGSAKHPPVLGNTLVGATTLLFSPGKSILLYSPTILIALCGAKGMIRKQRSLGPAVLIACVVQFAFVSTLSFFGGDWCWGPRYFVPIMPLLALCFPFVDTPRRGDRLMARALVAASVLVQLLGISMDDQRFFFSRNLPGYFWYRNSAFYFHQSALFSRPVEIYKSMSEGVPTEAHAFRPGPYQDLLTYSLFFPAASVPSSVWMREYRVFWLPRPWPFWMSTIPRGQRPIDVRSTILVFLVVPFAGLSMIVFGSSRTINEGANAIATG